MKLLPYVDDKFVGYRNKSVQDFRFALSEGIRSQVFFATFEYYGAAEPPVRCGESHLSGLTEPPHFIY